MPDGSARVQGIALQSIDGIARDTHGEFLLPSRRRDGMAALSTQHGTPIRQTGPVQMPLVLFEGDGDLAKANVFCSRALRAGAYFHPKHNMFLSTAHGAADIEAALAAADAGFAAVARM